MASAPASVIERKSLTSAPVARAPIAAPSAPAVITQPEVKEAAINEAKPRGSEEEEFGLAKPKKIKSRTLPILSAAPFGAKGYMRFTLENGEVWQQTEPGRFSLGRADPDLLTIKRAAFGSFRGRANDKGSGVRMRRVK